MKKDILLIYNPSSGKNVAKELLSDIIYHLRKLDCRVVVYPVIKGFGCEEIIRRENGKFDCVVCCGGDGTLSHTINGIMSSEHKPFLGYIPTGSTNDFANSMGIKKDVESACRAIAYGQPFYYDVGQFNDIFFNYIAAFGAFTQVSYSTPQTQKNYLGHAAYIIEGLKHLPIGVYYKVKATSGGKTYSGEYIYGSVSSSTSVGGFSIAKNSDIQLNDGLFEVILIKEPKTVAETQSIISAVLSGNFDSPYIDCFKTDSIEFEFEQPVSWTLDGEYGGHHKQVKIRVKNQAIGLMR